MRGAHFRLTLALLLTAVVGVACGDGGNTASKIQQLPIKVGKPALDGELVLPAKTPNPPVIVMLSGSGPNDLDSSVGPNAPFKDIALGLADQGVATLRYEKRTRRYPLSVNPATFTAADEYLPDARAAFALLKDRTDIDPARIFLLGHSLGGTLAPFVAKSVPGYRGIVLMAPAAESIPDSLVRQVRYLATLPGVIGQQATAQLPLALEAQRQANNPALKPTDTLTSPLLGGAGGAYFLSLRPYNAPAAAAAFPRPILLLQGERDYQVTMTDDYAKFVAALAGRTNLTTHTYASANHLFIDGRGAPSPADYENALHVDDRVISDIAAWATSIGG